MQEFFKELFYILTYLLPRPISVEPNEGGVLLRFGKYKATVPIGWTWVWLPIEYVQVIDVTEQVVDLRAQSLTTKDKKTLAVSGAISYIIEDPKKALLDVQSVDSSMPTLSLGIIANYVTTHTFPQCLKTKQIVEAVREGIEGAAIDRWGVKILNVWITDVVEHKVLRVMGSNEVYLTGEEDDK